MHRRNAILSLTVLLSLSLTYAQQVKPVIKEIATPIPLTDVRLTGGPLKRAQDLDAEYLLRLEPDRMMAGYRIRAGLQPKAEGYGGWDSPSGRQLTGHIAGHYLSAVSLMYAATGDERFKPRADYLVKELKEVQDKRGTGYLGAIADKDGTDGAVIFEQQIAKGQIRSGGFDLNGMWSPWYTLHKTFAGLRDAYRYTGNKTALELEIRFASWAEKVLSGLTDQQIQQMLNTEFGGMNEVLVDLYADTGDARWLRLADRFYHRQIVEPLARHIDILPGNHGNTQVPKLLGCLVEFIYTGDLTNGFATGFFWDCVVHHHTFATGGHGRNEYFGQPDRLYEIIDGRTAETCNVYNMLKLTRRLFAIRPDAEYAEFQERALFNHILGSIDPNDGSTCYMVPVGQGVQREYQDMFSSFTCCVGTGMESHALHGDGVYYHAKDRLWVNLYVPSIVQWPQAGARLAVETDLPEGEKANITLSLKNKRRFTLLLRRPGWTTEQFAINVNGQQIPVPQTSQRPSRDDRSYPFASGSYVELDRTWSDGDRIEVHLPKQLRLERLADNPQCAAIMWGPLVLAADLGSQPRARRDRSEAQRPQIPALVVPEGPVDRWLVPVEGKARWFRTKDAGKPNDLELCPFYRLHRRTYMAYFDIFTPAEWERRAAERQAEQERQARLEAATVAYVQPGQMQPERDFNMQGEQTSPVRFQGRAGRRATGWFSFDIPVDANHPMALVVTYNTDQQRTCSFDILLDGQRIGQETIGRRSPEQQVRFFDVEYPIPSDLIKDNGKVTVRFQAQPGSQTAAVYGIRMIRADAIR
ncbi:MAG: glycoside hydrolase family 127 protein [Sedimentisphaerales bacterium]|nr:glycoside hydrolase family 127 protein [Sedimentisphaerales bacterium]